ncbi:hypothetical protein G6F68_020326 [Rhizopus microsporus]|nr:hypothetical protein G6F68_020326 [Rhizopus microsporus]
MAQGRYHASGKIISLERIRHLDAQEPLWPVGAKPRARAAVSGRRPEMVDAAAVGGVAAGYGHHLRGRLQECADLRAHGRSAEDLEIGRAHV